MPTMDQEDQKLKDEIDEIMKRVDRILKRIENQDPGKTTGTEGSGQ
jgi:hypothetical protein